MTEGSWNILDSTAGVFERGSFTKPVGRNQARRVAWFILT